MRFSLFYLFVLCGLCSLFSCDSEDPAIDVPEVPDFEVKTIEPDGTEHFLNENSDYIFDQNKLHTFELNLPTSALEKINNDPAAETYVEGSLTFEGETISPVGVRYKGSIGAFVGCLSGINVFDPSGSKTCTKLSMKIKINWNGSETQFFKLKKLQLHSMNNDNSQMRERLGYWLFREMGVPAPRVVHARLLINGSYAGLFALVEQIDGRFTRYNFEDGKGNLYKEIWPLQMNGTPYPDQSYLSALKTNEDENPSIDMIKNFGTQISNAGEPSLKNIIRNTMDLDKIMAYIAVDRTIRHDDGPFHWYCGGGDCSNHNYYWYEETEQEKLHLIPWDLDHAFENIINPNNVVTNIDDDWGEITNNCQPFFNQGFDVLQWSAACDKLTAGWGSFETELETKIAALKTGPMSFSEADRQLDLWCQQIEDATVEANQIHGDAISVVEWKQAINELKQQIAFARED